MNCKINFKRIRFLSISLFTLMLSTTAIAQPNLRTAGYVLLNLNVLNEGNPNLLNIIETA
jgi:hypothetical protein